VGYYFKLNEQLIVILCFLLAIINFYVILCYFSSLYPIGSCFFLIHLQDGTKAYRPESQIVMDVPTAWAFFGARPDDTLQKVGEVTRNLVRRWNEDYCDKVNIDKNKTFILMLTCCLYVRASFDQQFFQLSELHGTLARLSLLRTIRSRFRKKRSWKSGGQEEARQH